MPPHSNTGAASGRRVPDGAALVSVPDWFWGERPQGYFEAAEMHAKIVGRAPLTLQVKTDERHYRRRRPDLVRALQGTGPWDSRDDLSGLEALSDPRVDDTTLASARKIVAKRRDTAESIAEAFYFSQLHTVTTTSDTLVAQVRAGLETLSEMATADGESIFPNGGAMGIRRSDALVTRIKFASVQLRLQRDEKLARGDRAHVRALMKGLTFESSSKLYQGTYLLSTYTDPLMAALAPGMWAYPAARGRGPVIYSLGKTILGAHGSPAEPLHLITGPGALTTFKSLVLSPSAPWATVTWWADRLNELFSITSDFAVFTDVESWYQPSRHMQWLLTVEQLFTRTHSVLVTQRDNHARQVLLFTVLDTLMTLTAVPLERLCSATYAKKTLERLRNSIPAAAREILLPRAESAVSALEAVQNGFFMRNPDGTVTLDAQKGRKAYTLDDAAAQYLKLLRNATHGHGSNKGATAEMTDSLLAHHTGELDHALPLLSYLYLLDFMTMPERTKSIMSRPPKPT